LDVNKLNRVESNFEVFEGFYKKGGSMRRVVGVNLKLNHLYDGDGVRGNNKSRVIGFRVSEDDYYGFISVVDEPSEVLRRFVKAVVRAARRQKEKINEGVQNGGKQKEG